MPGGRPRMGKIIYVRPDGQVYVARDTYDELQKSAKAKGLKELRHMAWRVCDDGDGTVEIWPSPEKNEFTSAINVSGPKCNIQFNPAGSLR